MALSKIWSSFIIVSLLVASFQCFVLGDDAIFNRMVIGKADDQKQNPIFFTIENNLYPSEFKNQTEFIEYANGFSFYLADSLNEAKFSVVTNSLSEEKSNENSKIISIDRFERMLVRQADGIIETCTVAVNICIRLIGIMTLFMGLMSIAEKAGGVRFLSRVIGPFFSKLFPDIPKNHPATGHMMMNFSANLLGLDNAATPFGIKAMQSLQEINPNKDSASNAQIMFLCLHASGLTLIPVSIIAARAALNSKSPTDIFIPCLIATFVATIAAMSLVSIKQKINLFQTTIIAWIGITSLIITGLVMYLVQLQTAELQSFSGILSNGIILLLFFIIVGVAWYRKTNVFDAFIDGAKGGFETAIKIIPYLVGILVAISFLRTSGTFDMVIAGMKSFFQLVGFDTRFVDGLPTALIKPLSGSGARGMMIDTMKAFSPDSFAGRLACILQGSSDTTFYVVAVYFGAVGIKNSRYTISLMLLADLAGIVTSILLCYLFFG